MPLAIRTEQRHYILKYVSILISVIVCALGTIAVSLCKPARKDPQPYHMSILSGEGWLLELLTGHPERIRTELGMHRDAFLELVSALRTYGHADSRSVTLEEQVAIFLYTYFRKMNDIFATAPFYLAYVKPSDGTTVPSYIRDNPKFWPYFKDAIGAIDGSHIAAKPPASARSAFRNRKGYMSQNCIFVCDFNMMFTYVLTGWEGSASDARIYDDACSRTLHIPDGKFLLADLGFPCRASMLVPYRGVRYHLAEWGRANVRPTSKEELFNLRHASARNVIERIFGVLKKRFRILLLPPGFAFPVQARIPAALCAIHNFMRIHDPDPDHAPDDEDGERHNDHMARLDDSTDMDNADILPDARMLRDRIAESMWVDYLTIRNDRAPIDDAEDSDDIEDFDDI